jgi:hypothetical protein
MLGARLMQLIQAHSSALSKDVIKELTTNERTPSFRRLTPLEMEARIASLFENLGSWIGNADERLIRHEYERMGRARFREGVRISEIVYALLVSKQHLRRYVRDHGLVEFAGDRIVPEEFLPVELQSIQELNYQIGEFFDRALYYLALGYEMEAAGISPAA